MSGTQINTGVCTSMVGARQLATIRVLSACASNPIIRCKISLSTTSLMSKCNTSESYSFDLTLNSGSPRAPRACFSAQQLTIRGHGLTDAGSVCR
jgi:hypothetical protein